MSNTDSISAPLLFNARFARGNVLFLICSISFLINSILLNIIQIKEIIAYVKRDMTKIVKKYFCGVIIKYKYLRSIND